MHRCLSELAKSGEEFVDVPEFLTIVTYFVGFINNVFDVRRSLWDALPNLVICVGIQIRRVTQGSCRLCVPSDEILEESSDFSSEFVQLPRIFLQLSLHLSEILQEFIFVGRN